VPVIAVSLSARSATAIGAAMHAANLFPTYRWARQRWPERLLCAEHRGAAFSLAAPKRDRRMRLIIGQLRREQACPPPAHGLSKPASWSLSATRAVQNCSMVCRFAGHNRQDKERKEEEEGMSIFL
jgi:hypothetical protein